MSKEIKEMLEFDTIANTEKVLGKHHSEWSLKEDAFFALASAALHNRRKKALLEAAGDTTFSNQLADYLRITKEIGFEIVLRLPFKSIPYDKFDEARDEEFYVLWEPRRGILLTFDTYDSVRVNGGKFYYNVRPKNRDEFFSSRCTSSGGFHFEKGKSRTENWNTGIWVGDHDCREGLKFHINQLETHADFVNPWIGQPFLWLLNYSDTKEEGYDYKAINKERIALLPDYVRAAIGDSDGRN